jgi:uncharacterized membrane protein
MAEETASTGLSENAASGLAYVTIIPAIIFLVMPPYNQNSSVRFHSWQSIFLFIAWIVVWVGLMVIGAVPVVRFLDVILFPVMGIIFFVLWIVVMVNALNGKRVSLPVIGALSATQAAGKGL